VPAQRRAWRPLRTLPEALSLTKLFAPWVCGNFALVREIYRSAHFLVDVDDVSNVFRRRRTDVGYASTDEIDSAYDALFAAVESFHRPEYGLLSDMRLAPPRNDAAFERAVGRYHARFYGGFHKIAHLVKSEAGRLQITRMARPDTARRMRVFTSETAALDFLTGLSPAGAPTRRR
jgi:hypothetical protein